MLFSNTEITKFINENFESSWESVRPVPRVTIDFGSGNVVRRTLHGNVATYVCDVRGDVVDVLPGVYSPEAYLEQLRLLSSQGELLRANEEPALVDRVRHYHSECIGAILVRGGREEFKGAPSQPRQNQAAVDAKGQLMQYLKVDTDINEGGRRLQIHGYLMNLNDKRVQPQDITKWLYREVLHADLDDPYMGLGEKLFGSYPFADKDAAGVVANR